MIFMALKALCFPFRLNLHIGILKKSYKAKKSYTVLLKKKIGLALKKFTPLKISKILEFCF